LRATRYGGVEKLPSELPFSTVELMATAFVGMSGDKMGGAIKAVILDLFGQEQYDQFLAMTPSLDDVMEMVESLMVRYGMKPGELEASSES